MDVKYFAMDSKSKVAVADLSKDEDDLRCPECFHTFYRPRMLPSCLHTFCETCIRAHVIAEIDKKLLVKKPPKCPICDTDIKGVPTSRDDVRQWSKRLPLNTAVVKATDKYTDDPHNTRCEPCKFRFLVSAADKRCLNCNEIYCRNCARVHQSSTATMHHTVENISENREKDSYPNLRMSEVSCCLEHSDYKIEYYCEDDKCFLCAKCGMEKHKQCRSIKRLDEINKRLGKEWTTDFRNDLNNLAARVSEIAEARQEIRKNADSKEHIKQLTKEFDKIQENFLRILEKHKESMISDAEKVIKAEKNKMDKVQKSQKGLLAAMKASYKLLGQVSEDDAKSKSAAWFDAFAKQIVNYKKKIEKDQTGIGLKQFSIHYTNRMDSIASNSPPLGSLGESSKPFKFSTIALSSNTDGLAKYMTKPVPTHLQKIKELSELRKRKRALDEELSSTSKSSPSLTLVQTILSKKPRYDIH